MSKPWTTCSTCLDVTAHYGTDALRFTLLTGGTPGNDMNLSEDKVAAKPQLRQQAVE